MKTNSPTSPVTRNCNICGSTLKKKGEIVRANNADGTEKWKMLLCPTCFEDVRALAKQQGWKMEKIARD